LFQLSALGAGVGLGIFAWAANPTTRPATTLAATTGPATTKPIAERPPLPKASVEKIEAAIKALSSDAWKERQAAQDTLTSFGQDAVPRLTQLAAKSPDEEVRTRAAAALRQIEENDMVGGSIVTLKLKDAKPQEV